MTTDLPANIKANDAAGESPPGADIREIIERGMRSDRKVIHNPERPGEWIDAEQSAFVTL